jgi:3-hydroxy-9,10-secoandrosta-1,3,5(10)-triene-9,17-dione monooxygenase reductase component
VETPAIDTVEFRRALGCFCTGVAVVTGIDQSEPLGFTVQSLVSLSLSPPLIGMSPAKTSGTWKRIRPSRRFCVNILSSEQTALCETFASKRADRFLGVSWGWSANGLPVLEHVMAYVCCRLETEHETGDHFFTVGRVQEIATLRDEAEPLLFLRGAFRSALYAETMG